MSGKRSDLQRVIDKLTAEKFKIDQLLAYLHASQSDKPTRKPRQPKAEKKDGAL